ncbi:MAG: peptidase and in kexin sedolisin, partial [Thermoleophilia bacterium]|nr:peptidase and in kexin sedolisin [Thermoleophilia bacterium]
MALRASVTSRRVFAVTACFVLVGLSTFVGGAGAADRRSDAEIVSSGDLALDLQAPLLAALRDRLPAGLEGRIVAPASQLSSTTSWAQLPDTLDGRVRLGVPKSNALTTAGWQMLDTPADLNRINVSGGAAYLGHEWDVLQMVDTDRLREYVVVNEHQGAKTWRWRLFTTGTVAHPVLRADGTVDLGGGYLLQPPKLLGADLAPLTKHVAWKLAGDVLSLSFSDVDLALPYVIDPDATPPTTNFVQWRETSPYAHYDSNVDLTRLWFNPTYTGSAVASVNAADPDTGVNFVSWPTGPTGWTPPGGDDSAALDAPGLVATYWDNSQAATYPGTNFTGPAYTRNDPDINFNWGTGTPYAALGVDSFSVRWTGKLEAPETGVYHFQTTSDDGARMWVDGVEQVSAWTEQSSTSWTGCAGGISLTAGVQYDFTMEFYENGGGAEARARWLLPSQTVSYQTPTGCTTGSSPPVRHQAGYTGGGSATYPTIPSNWFTVGGGQYDRTYVWGVGASGGTVNATATNNGGPTTTTNVPFTMSADDTQPASSGSIATTTTGWSTSNAPMLSIPPATAYTDAGSGPTGLGADTYANAANASLRRVERRTGSADGLGGCGGYGVWNLATTDPAGTTLTSPGGALTAGQCAQFRYVVVDHVGNELVQQAPGFYGYDDPGFVITPGGPLSVDEAGVTTATYTVALTTPPSSSVTFTITPDDQVTISPAPSITFTPGSWATPQTVSVGAVDDSLVEASTHTGTIAHSVTSADATYAAVVPAPMYVDVTDDDTPNVVVTQAPPVEVTEGSLAGNTTYTVQLGAQPVGDVTITPTADAQVTVLPASATFTNTDWNTPQTFTVTAVDDDLDELDPHPGNITHAVTSTDPLWASLTTAAPVAAIVHDDDVAGVIVTQSGPYTLSEDTPAATVSYAVKLSTEPTGSVDVTLTVPGDLNA